MDEWDYIAIGVMIGVVLSVMVRTFHLYVQDLQERTKLALELARWQSIQKERMTRHLQAESEDPILLTRAEDSTMNTAVATAATPDDDDVDPRVKAVLSVILASLLWGWTNG
jgi:hypothetical protein